jgi:hypothetical protein
MTIIVSDLDVNPIEVVYQEGKVMMSIANHLSLFQQQVGKSSL